MEIGEYQKRAMETCLPESNNALYMLLEIAEETGELLGKYAKAIRHGTISFNQNQSVLLDIDKYSEFQESIVKEAGDILWGLAGFANVIGVPLDAIAQINLEKLASRKQRNMIDGSGDNR